MERYVPPFTITNQMLMLVAEIAEKTGSVSNFHSFETKPHLRRTGYLKFRITNVIRGKQLSEEIWSESYK